jgi:hypothetical protein
MRFTALSDIRRPITAGIAFFSTVCVLSVGYAAWNASMPTATSGGTLTATGWNAVVGNVDDLNTRVTGLSSATGPWVASGGNISYTGGNVGIGTVSPTTLLQLNATAPQLAFSRSGVIEFLLQNWSDGNSYVDYKNNLYFRNGIGGVGNTYPLTLTSFGNVGIGTSTPSTKFHVYGNVNNGIVSLTQNNNAGAGAFVQNIVSSDSGNVITQINSTAGGGAGHLYSSASNGLNIYTSNASKLYL